MPGEIVSLHLGGAGNTIGNELWSRFYTEFADKAGEHSTGLAGPVGSTGAPSFFYESERGSLCPRCIFIDSNIHLGVYVEPECQIALRQDCRSNFFEGISQWKGGASDRIVEGIRVQTERCDALSGFLLFHSLSGGTGSGIGVESNRFLRDEFPKQVILDHIIYPSKDSSNSVVGPYNTVFGLTQAHKQSSVSFLLDNQAAFRICREKRGILNPSYSHMNEIIADLISMVTSSLRGRTTLNASLNEILTNLVPEPDFHYPIVSYAPLGQKRVSPSTRELVSSLFRPSSTFCDVPNIDAGRFFAASILCRGQGGLSVPEIIKSLSSMRATSGKFVPWIPNSFKVGVVEHCALKTGVEAEAVLIANSTSVRDLFDREYKKVLHLLFHKAFVWQYLEAGAEMDDFIQSRETMKSIISRYDETLTEIKSCESSKLRTELNSLS